MTPFQPKPGAKVRSSDNGVIVLDSELGKGGEGSVWSIKGAPTVAAKFYHAGLQPLQAEKLQAMCRLKTESLLQIAAWPTAILSGESSGAPVGMLMPKIQGYKQAHLLYTPKSRRVNFPEAQFPFILHACMNIARAFASVHSAGQVIGDVNHGNLLVSDDATVALIDCDSFEIRDGQLYFPCLVGVPTYTPPELQGRSFRGVRRTPQHDAFGLAVLLFHMLFLGRHPFAGIYRQGTADKTIEDAIREARFAYLPDRTLTEMEPPPFVPTLGEVPPELASLFVRAFRPTTQNAPRPEALEWITALETAQRNLKRCAANDRHHYFSALSSCPWCRVEKAFGLPVFGFKTSIVAAGPDFNIVAVWAEIEALGPASQVSPLTVADYVAQCQPEECVSAAKATRRINRLKSAGCILVALLIVGSGFASDLPAIVLLAVGLYATGRFWKKATAATADLTSAQESAERALDSATKRFQGLQNVPDRFLETKRALHANKEELAALPAYRAQRLRELQTTLLRQKQLTRYLERHRIETATIPGIGPGRKTLLLSYGIEDASDVHDGISIKGFGPALKTALVSWRFAIERGFVFNPNEAVDPRDVQALEHEIAQKRAALTQSLLGGAQTLRGVLRNWEMERASAAAFVNHCAKTLAQADVNVRALGWL